MSNLVQRIETLRGEKRPDLHLEQAVVGLHSGRTRQWLGDSAAS